jgi:hypothetical protein
MVAPMSSEADDRQRKASELLRQLAQKALIEAQRAADPAVREVVTTLAAEYLMQAQMIEGSDQQ